jgi:HEAT repeat protein
MRRKQIVIASLILSAIVIGGVVFFFLRSIREPVYPVYQGKPLNVWLKGYDSRKSGGSIEMFGPNWRETSKIVQEAGTNAIPTLLRLLREEDLKKHNIDVNGQEASMGFAALGVNAKDAAPSLMEIYEKNPAARVDVLYCLGCIGPAAEEAVPWLLQKLPATDAQVRDGIISALGEIHAQSDRVVPVLINCLDDSNSMVRGDAALALSYYGTNASPAVPQLVRLLNDQGKGVKNSAAFALKRIDTEAAAKAGLKPASQSPPIAPSLQP